MTDCISNVDPRTPHSIGAQFSCVIKADRASAKMRLNQFRASLFNVFFHKINSALLRFIFGFSLLAVFCPTTCFSDTNLVVYKGGSFQIYLDHDDSFIGVVQDFKDKEWLDLKVNEVTTRRIQWITITRVEEQTDEVRKNREQIPSATEKYFSVMVGLGFLLDSTKESIGIYGGRVGFGLFGKEKPNISVGAVFQRHSRSQQIGGLLVDYSFNALVMELVSRRVFSTGLYLGARFGATYITFTVGGSGGAVGASGVGTAFGSVIGYELLVGNSISLIFDTSFIKTSSTNLVINGTQATLPGTSAVLLQAGLVLVW